ncbi:MULTISPECIES: phosphate signaling complex PhoU family protein [Nocardia]|uniref:phosphate signaling complex PhoU family protein n=1 Tax=Nocardia TaxID=1817 RepID=UPI000D69DF48|nr:MULTISPECIES: PhoU domain-containing protein [Nocardia]
MRTEFHDNLDHLAGQLQVMCRRDRDAVAVATDALLAADVGLAEQALDLCGDLDVLRDRIETTAVSLLALQAPVAGELRQVVTAIQLAGHLTRMGVLTGHIADIARRRHPLPAIPEPVHPIVAGMGAAAVTIADGAIEVLGSGDPHEAAALDDQDDVMDGLQHDLLTAVLAPEWTEGISAAVDLTLISRYYERFADNAVEVGRRTIFMATGQTPETWRSEKADRQ